MRSELNESAFNLRKVFSSGSFFFSLVGRRIFIDYFLIELSNDRTGNRHVTKLSSLWEGIRNYLRNLSSNEVASKPISP